PYNRILGKKLGLLPTPLKAAVKAPDKARPFLVDRRSFRAGPPAYWIFQDDPKFYAGFDEVAVWQHVVIDEAGALAQRNQQKPEQEKKDADEKDDDPLSILMRLNNGQALAASQRVGAGEVVFVATAAHPEGWIDAKAFIPN